MKILHLLWMLTKWGPHGAHEHVVPERSDTPMPRKACPMIPCLPLMPLNKHVPLHICPKCSNILMPPINKHSNRSPRSLPPHTTSTRNSYRSMPSSQHAPAPLHGGSSLSRTPATGFPSATLFLLHTRHVIVFNNCVHVFSTMVVYIAFGVCLSRRYICHIGVKYPLLSPRNFGCMLSVCKSTPTISPRCIVFT